MLWNPMAPEFLKRCACRRPSAGVEGLDFPVFRSPDQSKEVAAYAGRVRFDDVQDGGRGHGSIYCVASVHHGPQACSGSERLSGCDHPICCADVRAP